MSLHQEAVKFANIAASKTFAVLLGGFYTVDVVATFSGGSVEIQKLGPDGTTYVSLEAAFNNAGTEADLVIGKFSANGSKVLTLSPGAYQVTVTTATAVFVNVVRASVE